MAIKINADNSTGLEITSDTSTNIDLQSNDVTKMSIGSTIDIQGNELVLDADGDSSIHSSVDDQIDFKTGGTDRMHLDASGQLGIGTSSPSQKLDVNGTINATAFATSPVLSAIAGLSFGEVGTFCFAKRSDNTTAGTTYAGSQLSRAGLMTSGFNTNAYEYNNGATLSGTWRSLGTADDTRNSNPCYTIYVRIS